MTRSIASWLSVVFAIAPAWGERPIDFDTQIVPILTRQGCNAGSCHGAAVGRGGFQLSLFGSDAAADHAAIVYKLEGRRVNLDDASKSLLLLKPSEQTDHEGGLRLDDESEAFAIVQSWIEQGANRNQSRRLADLAVSPNDWQLDRPGESFVIKVTATFDDSTQEDVTRWTSLKADAPDAVSIDSTSGSLTVNRRGAHLVIARFMDRVIPIRVTLPFHDASPTSGMPPVSNFIDRYVNDQLKKLRLPSSPQADDYAIFRRVTLDLTGRLPTPADVRRFVADTSPTKIEQLIDRLLGSDAFADYWALKWANVLLIDAKQLQAEGADAFHRWLAAQLHNDVPVDQSVRDLLTATGDSYVRGAVNFSRVGSGPGDQAEYVSRVWMGVRLRCANCHNHPLDHWKQDDYHGLAAIFAKLKKGRVVTLSDRGHVTHPISGQPAVQRIPGERYLEQNEDGRLAFADWLIDKQNPYFARALVNRVWQQLMGRGLADPVDDMRITNPATHPRLLDRLAEDFVDQGFRLKHTIKTICLSATYQRSSQATDENRADAAFYSHALTRQLEAEVIADAIGDVTGVPLEFEGDATHRAIELTNNRIPSPSLDVLGRCDRSTNCVGIGQSTASLSRALHLMNGALINSRLDAASGRLSKLLSQGRTDEDLIDSCYMLTLSRPASEREQIYWAQQVKAVDSDSPKRKREFVEDVLWSLLTSRSFATNH